MAWRVRVRLRFQAGSPMTGWAHAQMVARMGQAFHLNEGTPAEEASYHEMQDDTYVCDVFFPSEALALDTWATLLAASVTAHVRPDDEDDASWADLHECGHDVGGPCPKPSTRWTLGV